MSNEGRNVRTRPVLKVAHSITLLDAVDTVSTGATFDLGGGYITFALMAFRATTGAAGGSTKPSYRLEGSINPASTAAKWFTIGAATRTITTNAGTLATLTSTAPISAIRARINLFTTSGGANPDKVKTTVIVQPII